MTARLNKVVRMQRFFLGTVFTIIAVYVSVCVQPPILHRCAVARLYSVALVSCRIPLSANLLQAGWDSLTNTRTSRIKQSPPVLKNCWWKLLGKLSSYFVCLVFYIFMCSTTFSSLSTQRYILYSPCIHSTIVNVYSSLTILFFDAIFTYIVTFNNTFFKSTRF